MVTHLEVLCQQFGGESDRPRGTELSVVGENGDRRAIARNLGESRSKTNQMSEGMDLGTRG